MPLHGVGVLQAFSVLCLQIEQIERRSLFFCPLLPCRTAQRTGFRNILAEWRGRLCHACASRNPGAFCHPNLPSFGQPERRVRLFGQGKGGMVISAKGFQVFFLDNR